MGVKFAFLSIALVASTLALPSIEGPRDESEFLIQPNSAPRIIGGQEAAAGSHPHMVALTTGLVIKSYFCGGSLVASRTVLTAAHCVTQVVGRWGALSSSLRGTMGTNRWRSGTTFSFSRYVIHPNYDSSTIKNDIGLLITSGAVSLSNTIRIVPMNFDFVEGNVPVTVAGWGSTRVGGSASTTLRELQARTMDGELCKWEVPLAATANNLRAPPVDPEVEICAFHSRGNGMCTGDAGSAMVLQESGAQVGIVSWGVPCAVGGPDVYVRLSAYRAWLFMNLV